MQSTLLLDVVVTQGAAVLELLSGEDKTLLIRGDSLLILDLGLYVIDGVRWLNIKRNGLAYITRCIPDIGSLINDLGEKIKRHIQIATQIIGAKHGR